MKSEPGEQGTEREGGRTAGWHRSRRGSGSVRGDKHIPRRCLHESIPGECFRRDCTPQAQPRNPYLVVLLSHPVWEAFLKIIIVTDCISTEDT